MCDRTSRRSLLCSSRNRISQFCFIVLVFCDSGLLRAQDNSLETANEGTSQNDRTISHRIESHLQSGEFPLALTLIDSLPAATADPWRAALAAEQQESGGGASAFTTAATIRDDRLRTQTLVRLNSVNSDYLTQPSQSGLDIGLPTNSIGNNGTSGNSNGNEGGVSAQDFTNLINLITTTVDSDSWQANGTGTGMILAYPAGVYVDGAGALQRLKIQPQLNQLSLRSHAFFDRGNRQPQWPAELRKVSLTRLEKMAQLRVAQSLPIDDAMQNLAGLTEIKFVMAYPDSQEVIIAGPAGPWHLDAQGRSVNTDTGRPVLQLDDLVVCLQNAYQNEGKFGCSINPRPHNLAATQQFLTTSNLRGKAWSQALRRTLGLQDIEVFGLDERTHAARVLVEADYRMKLIGMGLEPSLASAPSYLERVQLNADGTAPPTDVIRWWFTMNYDDVLCDEAKEVFTFVGTGVKVLSENEMLNEQGQRVHTGQTGGPTLAFARDFTQHFVELADRYPVYRELKNVFDLALVANLIRQQHLDAKSNWHLTFFGPPRLPSGTSRIDYPFRLGASVKVVDSVVNERVIKVRKPHSTLKHTLVGVSGGISFDATEAMGPERLKTVNDESLAGTKQQSSPAETESHWWWD